MNIRKEELFMSTYMQKIRAFTGIAATAPTIILTILSLLLSVSVATMTPKSREYYCKILGVALNADKSTIEKSFRKLALKYHPDKHLTEPEEVRKACEEKFKEIQEARKYLLNNPIIKHQKTNTPYSNYGNRNKQYGKTRNQNERDVNPSSRNERLLLVLYGTLFVCYLLKKISDSHENLNAFCDFLNFLKKLNVFLEKMIFPRKNDSFIL